MGTLTSVAFAATLNIRFRSFHCSLRGKIKTPMPKVTSGKERLYFSCSEDYHRFRVVKCLGNDQNGNGGENGDTDSSLVRDSTVTTASREAEEDNEDEEADERSNSSSSINEFGSDKSPSVSSRVHTLVSCLIFTLLS